MKMNTQQVIIVKYVGNALISVTSEERERDSVQHVDCVQIGKMGKFGGKTELEVLNVITRALGYMTVAPETVQNKISDERVLSCSLVQPYIHIWSSKTISPFIKTTIKNILRHIRTVTRYFYGDFDTIISKTLLKTPGECSDADNASHCASCISKYSGLVQMLDFTEHSEMFPIARRIRKQHLRSAKGDREELLINCKKWEQYLLQLVFNKFMICVSNSSILDLDYIPKMITDIRNCLKAESLLRDYQNHHRASSAYKVQTIREYRKLIVASYYGQV